MTDKSIRIVLALILISVMCGMYIYFATSIGASPHEMVPPRPVAVSLIVLWLAVTVGLWRLSGERLRTSLSLIGMISVIGLLILRSYQQWSLPMTALLSLAIVCVAIFWPQRKSTKSIPPEAS